MRTIRLIVSSLFHYRGIHLAVLAGVALTSAILSGALVVGDSVKESLRRNAAARLSQVGPVLMGGERFFTSALADRLAAELGGGAVVAPVLQITGTALNRDDDRRVNRVQILGVDDRFWELSNKGVAPEGFEDERWIAINAPLAHRVGAEPQDTLIVRVEIPGALSKDAPLSGESEQATPFSAVVTTVLDAEQFGLYSLKAEQVPPATIFLRRERLEAILEQPGRANLLLGDHSLDAAAFAAAAERVWDLEDLQLQVTATDAGTTRQMVSSRVFFDSAIIEALQKIASVSSPVLTYLATDIAAGEKATPYSMVTGVGPALNDIVVDDLPDDQIVLSQWLADDLGVGAGDAVTLVYNVVGTGRALEEESRSFRVAGIKPIGQAGWDQSWTPDFPGIFDVDGLDDWEPGIPIDRDRIRDKDDEYWDQYKATPKAFVSLAAARSMWANRFGDATAVRFQTREPDTPLVEQLRGNLQLTDLGMAYRDLPAEARSAVADSFDFGALFASMSFFLIVAALVLSALVFVFGIEQRSTQIGLLLAMGFTRRRVRRMFLVEALLLSLAGAALGLLGGYVYTRLALYGMSGVWQEAAAGMEFLYSLKPQTLLLSFAITVSVALVVVWFASRRVTAIHPSTLISGSDDLSLGAPSKNRRDLIALVVGLAGAAGCLFAPKVEGTMAAQGLFFGAGFLMTVAGVACCSLLIRRFLRPSATLTSLGALGRQHTVRRRGRSLAVIGLMAAGVFMVTAINSFRLEGSRGAERRNAGTGGFAYVGESTLPIYEDLNGADGRKKFGLDGFQEKFTILPFRVSDGDDASCLNLNRAQQPRLLGIDAGRIAAINPFTFTATLTEPRAGESPWRLLAAEHPALDDGTPVIAGILDQNTALYALQKGIGDTVLYETVSGQPFAVRICGFLETSLLQGALLIDEAAFVRFFPDAGGYRFFLMDGKDRATLEPVASHLTRMFGDLGLEMRPAADRLNEFNAVQNTYLSIFSTLGGLGVLLGTLGLAIIVGRNVMERRGQLGVMQAMGFTRPRLSGMILSEHWFLHLAGVLIGLGAALLAVLPELTKGASSLPWGLLAGINAAILLGGLAFCAVAARLVLRGNLMEAIRRE
ncbi:MAG: FtsX-like permease family protein [Verrucomicrobiaceae bacterium]|nr:FtsX-like permease family protein [Verrucomicrobiaceae bacterium]